MLGEWLAALTPAGVLIDARGGDTKASRADLLKDAAARGVEEAAVTFRVVSDAGLQALIEAKVPRNIRVPLAQVLEEVFTDTEWLAVETAALSDPAAAAFKSRVLSHTHVTFGDNRADPGRLKMEALLDQAIAAGWVARGRKAEILAWRPTP